MNIKDRLERAVFEASGQCAATVEPNESRGIFSRSKGLENQE